MTLGQNLRKLLKIAGPPLCTEQSRFIPSVGHGKLGEELRELLAERNGFYAFESALLLRPSCSWGKGIEASVEEWNEPDLWISSYSDLGRGCFFFAEDIFGSQFCIADGGVFTFDPETGDRSHLASELDGWANEILLDYDFRTGHPLAHAWQVRSGRLQPRKRLIPKTPFVLNGDFDLGNLYEGDSVEAMKARADIALQLRDLPDGAAVRLVSKE